MQRPAKAFQTYSRPSVRAFPNALDMLLTLTIRDSQEVAFDNPTIQTWRQPRTRPWHAGWCGPQQETRRRRANRCLQLLDVHYLALTINTSQPILQSRCSSPFLFPSRHCFGCPPGLVHSSTAFTCVVNMLARFDTHYTDSHRYPEPCHGRRVSRIHLANLESRKRLGR